MKLSFYSLFAMGIVGLGSIGTAPMNPRVDPPVKQKRRSKQERNRRKAKRRRMGKR